MRTVVKLDKLIDKDEALALLDEYGDFIEKYTGIKCEWYVERHDFSVVPTTPDSDGDLKPTYNYRQALAKDVHNRYGDYGTDNILVWVHEDNFLFKGVWGVNWSSSHYKYSLHLARWDKDNSANTFGTLYHEQMHSFDHVIKDEGLGDIEPEYGGDWDGNVVHGKGDYKYIRYQENTTALKEIADRLSRAYKRRKDKHLHKVALMEQIVVLLTRIINILKK